MLTKEQSRAEKIFQRFEARNSNPRSELTSYNNFTFAVAVLLSAQTTDKAVNKVTAELFKIADTPEKMLDLGIDRLKDYIKTLGLFNNKAKSIIAMSRILISEYNSEIPTSRNELEKLPGIGRKSANVITNRLFGKDFIAVDTHVLRLASRLDFSESQNPVDVENDLIKVVPKRFHKNASDWLVLHGRYICKAKNPNCKECFLNDLCRKRQDCIKSILSSNSFEV
ncbi:MAG: endonuclease III [Holosporales bacterium]|jgi:endonuclease-3|nr:endonuclease III [Holosporales bacterium]